MKEDHLTQFCLSSRQKLKPAKRSSIPQIFSDKGENGNEVAENVNGAFGTDAVSINDKQFWAH